MHVRAAEMTFCMAASDRVPSVQSATACPSLPSEFAVPKGQVVCETDWAGEVFRELRGSISSVACQLPLNEEDEDSLS